MDVQSVSALLGAVSLGVAIGLKTFRVTKARCYDPFQAFVERLGNTMTSVEEMTKEFGPNGGKSLKATVERIDQRTLMTDARQAALIASQPDAMFEACHEGEFTAANRALEELTGFSRAHLTGNEWVNAIHQQDRFRVVQAWQHAVKDERAWLDNFRIMTSAGRVLLVRVEAHPMRESMGERKVVGWLGNICVEERG